jgi:peptide/nickel transport system permease protein
VRYLLLAVAAVVLNFALPRALPGDPLGLEGDDGLGAAVSLPAEAQAQLRAYYRLDEPLPAQFGAYVAGIARLDLGWSTSRNAPVAAVIAERLPWTLSLVLTATLVAAVVGAAAGMWAAWRGGTAGRLVSWGATVLAGLPEFLVAMALLLVFAVWLQVLPLYGVRSPFASYPAGLAGALAHAGDLAAHLALPVAALAITHSAAFVMVTRAAMSETIASPYVDLARAKGLSERGVALRHALPNALLPVVTLLGLRVGLVFGGAIVVERVFGVPGVGLLAFQAVRARDYPVMQGVFLLASLAVLVAVLVVELLYRRLSPVSDETSSAA